MAKRIDVDALLARTDIVAVIERYVPLKKSGSEFEACCPFHTEATPSFKVSPSKQIYHCFGCGENGNAIGFLMKHCGMSFLDACTALGADALPASDGQQKAPARERDRSPWMPVMPVPATAPEPPKAHPVRGLPERVWRYLDAEGRLLGLVFRFRRSGGGKEIVPLVWARNVDSGAEEWHWRSFGDEGRPLYGLDRLHARPDAPVLLVEGEKCADAGDSELPELVVVSWSGGGKADSKTDFSPLAGRRVITWADADAKRERLTKAEAEAGVKQESKPLLPIEQQPGYETMARIRHRLAEMGCTLFDVKLPPLGAKPDGWDIADAIAEGMRGKELAEFIRANAKPWRVVPTVPAVPVDVERCSGPPDDNPPPLGEIRGHGKGDGPLLVDGREWLDSSQPLEWVVDGLFQRGFLYAITAITNHGKTAIGLTLAMSVAAGRKFAGRELARGKVLLLCGENPDGFRTRMKATLDAMSLGVEEIAGWVVVLPVALPIMGVAAQIQDEARALGGEYALVLVDTSVSYYSGDSEDDNLQARTHAWNLRALTELPGRPLVIANCHPPKGADQDSLIPRGGGAFTNEIDANYTVWADGEVATLHWHYKKRGPDFDPIPFEFHGKTVEEHGISVPTVVALHITEDRATELRKQRTQEEDRLLYALLHHPDESYAGLASACGWNAERAKSKVFRVMDRLKKDKLVEKYRNKMVLTNKGKEEAKSIR